jgi:hypothetical protein
MSIELFAYRRRLVQSGREPASSRRVGGHRSASSHGDALDFNPREDRVFLGADEGARLQSDRKDGMARNPEYILRLVRAHCDY